MSNAYDDSFMMVNYIIVCICIFSNFHVSFRDRPFDFRGGGGGCFLKIFFLFSSDRKPEFFFLRLPKYFFQDKAKPKYFFLNSIYARNVFF